MFVSVLSLMCISVERFLAICHPMTYISTSFRTRLVLIIIWTVSLLTPSLDFYNIRLFHVGSAIRCAVGDEDVERIFSAIVMVVFYMLPLCVMSYTYVRIARCLWSSTSTRSVVTESKYNKTM